jgi:uncharacterized protein YbjT (DUF2867 family)
MTDQQTTLILGGTGKTGGRVAQRLRARGQAVRAASRSGATRFDWGDPTTWPAAVRGAQAMYLTYQPDLGMPDAAERIAPLVRLAVDAGVRRIVLLSGRGEPHVLPGEQVVRESGAETTVLRCAFFDQNFSEGVLREQVMAGEVAFIAGGVAEPFIDADDIADVAAAALTEPGHDGKIYELSGPRLLTWAEAVGEIAATMGREIRYVQITPEQLAAALQGHVPPEYVRFLIDLFAHILDGHNAHVDDGVERVLGRKPRDFRDFARLAAASGVWGA